MARHRRATKTKAGKRTVYLDSETVQILRGYLAGRQTGVSFNLEQADHW